MIHVPRQCGNFLGRGNRPVSYGEFELRGDRCREALSSYQSMDEPMRIRSLKLKILGRTVQTLVY